MSDHIGAFLKARGVFSALNINITEVSYNKAVDLHGFKKEYDVGVGR